MVRAKDYEEAVRLPSDHEYGNGVAIVPATATPRATLSAASKSAWWGKFRDPGAAAYYTFGGWKRSGFGDLNQHGPGRGATSTPRRRR